MDNEGKNNNSLTERKIKTLLKTIEIRLEGVQGVTKRARFSFLVLLIVSCTIFIVLWNAHYSWNRKSAFPSDMSSFLDIESCNQIKDQEKRNRCNAIIKEEDIVDEKTGESQKKLIYNGIQDKPCVTPESLNRNSSIEKNEDCIGSILPLYEFNRRNRAAEWTKSTNISIGLLGVTIHSNDLHLIGTGSLMLLTFWFAFSVRRENRTIVSLLRDIYQENKFLGLEKSSDEWDIANLVFQGIVSNLVFIGVTRDDLPMGKEEILQDTRRSTNQGVFNKVINLLTWFTRYGVFILFLAPFGVSVLLIWLDWHSLNMNSAYTQGFPKIGAGEETRQILFRYSLIAGTFSSIILVNCLTALILSNRTQNAMKFFKLLLNDPLNENLKLEDSGKLKFLPELRERIKLLLTRRSDQKTYSEKKSENGTGSTGPKKH